MLSASGSGCASAHFVELMDVAGGTGDISFKILNKAKQDSPGQLTAEITVSDINADMLEVGKKRAVEQGIFHDLTFEELNAEHLKGIETKCKSKKKKKSEQFGKGLFQQQPGSENTANEVQKKDESSDDEIGTIFGR